MSKTEVTRFLVTVGVLAGLGSVAAFSSTFPPKHSSTYELLHVSALVLLSVAMAVCLAAIFRILRSGRDHSDHH